MPGRNHGRKGSRSFSRSECSKKYDSPVDSSQVTDGINVNNFIPKCISNRFKNGITPSSYTLKATCRHGENVPQFTYTLSWYEDDKKYPKTKDLASDSDSVEKYSPSRLRNYLKKYGDLTRRCDGPCGRTRSVNELRQLGRCEHVICSLCIVNAPMVENEDGSMGCCNPKCFEMDLAALCPDPEMRRLYFQKIINKGNIEQLKKTYCGQGRRTFENFAKAARQLSSVTTLEDTPLSQRNAKELVELKAMIFETGAYEMIRRRRVEREIESTCTIEEAIEWILKDTGENIGSARIFCSKGSSFQDSEMFEINMAIYGRMLLYEFLVLNRSLLFVIDFTKKLQGTADSPYMR